MTDKTTTENREEKPTAVAGTREGLNTTPEGEGVATGQLRHRCVGCGTPHSGHHRTRSRRTYYLSGLFCRTCSLDGERSCDAEQAYEALDEDGLAKHERHEAEHVAAGRLEPRDER